MQKKKITALLPLKKLKDDVSESWLGNGWPKS